MHPDPAPEEKVSVKTLVEEHRRRRLAAEDEAISLSVRLTMRTEQRDVLQAEVDRLNEQVRDLTDTLSALQQADEGSSERDSRPPPPP